MDGEGSSDPRMQQMMSDGIMPADQSAGRWKHVSMHFLVVPGTREDIERERL